MLFVHDNPEEAVRRAENAYNWVMSNLLWREHIVPQWDAILQQAYHERNKKTTAKADGIFSGEEL
jgi:hypothetical protein